MAYMKRIEHAILVADGYIDGIRLLIDKWGDDDKWMTEPTDAELPAMVSRMSQVVLLSYYASELALKVLYQQDWDKDYRGSREHPVLDIFKSLKDETKELIERAFAERSRTDLHGDLFKYPQSVGTAADILSVCDQKFNFYRYRMFEKDSISFNDVAYDFVIVDVLRALVVVAKGRSPNIWQQYEEYWENDKE